MFVKDKNVWLLSVAQALFLACAVTFTSIVGILGLQYSPDPSFVTLPNALLTVGVAVSAIPMSYFMKHYSRNYGFLLGSFFGFCGFLCGFMAVVYEHFALLCLSAFFVGLYQSAVMYYRFAATEYVAPKYRAIVISMVLLGSLSGAFIAPFALQSSEHILGIGSYKAAYMLMMLFSLLSIVPLSLLKRLPNLKVRLGGQEVPDERALKLIFKSPKAICAVSANIGAWAGMILLMSAAPIAMKQDGYSFQQSVNVIQWHVLGMYFPSLFSGYLITRFGYGKILLAGCSALLLAIIVGLDGRSFYHYIVALLLVGLAWNFLYVSGSSLLLEAHNENESAKVQGINEFVGYFVATIAGFVSGLILTRFGWVSLLYVEFFILLFVLSMSIWYLRVGK